MEQVLHPVPAIPVGEKGQGIRTIPGLDAFEVLRHLVQGRIPGDLFELLRTSGISPDHGLLQPIRVIEDAGTTCSSGAEMALGKGILRIPLDLGDPAVLHMGEDAAFPEAQLTERRDHPLTVSARIHGGVPIQAVPIGCDPGQGGGPRHAVRGHPYEFTSFHGGSSESFY